MHRAPILIVAQSHIKIGMKRYVKNFAKDQGPTIPEADVVQRWEAKTKVSEPPKEYFRKKLSKLPF